MGKILTVTFNPVIDKSTKIDSLLPEKKLKCSLPNFEPGGGGLNVSRAIKKLGGTSLALFPAGGYTGKFLQKLVSDEGISFKAVEIKNHTRENLIVFDNSNNQQYRFGMPGPEIEEQEWKTCLEIIKNEPDVSFIVASGSLARGIPLDIIGRISEMAKVKGAKLVVDTSGPALQQAVNTGVYMIKPNLNELSSLVGKEELLASEVDDVAKDLIEKGNCQIIVVSLGKAGAIAVSKDEVCHMIPPVVKMKSTVGAGDSMVAGMVLALSEGKSIKEALRFGISCGTAATMNEGTKLCNLEDVKNLYPLVKQAAVL